MFLPFLNFLYLPLMFPCYLKLLLFCFLEMVLRTSSLKSTVSHSCKSQKFLIAACCFVQQGISVRKSMQYHFKYECHCFYQNNFAICITDLTVYNYLKAFNNFFRHSNYLSSNKHISRYNW